MQIVLCEYYEHWCKVPGPQVEMTHLTVTLGTTLAETLATLSSSSHGVLVCLCGGRGLCDCEVWKYFVCLCVSFYCTRYVMRLCA